MQSFLSDLIHRFPTTDFYVSSTFWLAVAVVVILFRLAPTGPLVKQSLLLVFNVTMLMMLPRFTLPSLLTYLTLCIFSYTVGRGLAVAKPEAPWRKSLATIGVTGVILILIVFKYRFVKEALLSHTTLGADFIFLIGISYSSFKAIHFIVENYKKPTKEGAFLDYANYMFFFPSFISGPINRFNHFVDNSILKRKTAFRDDISPGLERIIHGLFKKTVLTTILFPYTLTNMGIPLENMGIGTFLFGLYAYAFYFYFDFSGYTDLAIGSARLMGYVLPENFDFPFLKKNIQQLWAHWHMSLTSWITDYVYWPLVRKMRQSSSLREHPLLISNIAIVITFLICGIWHGEGSNYVLWGAYQGLGIAGVNVYQNWKRKVRDEKALKYFRSPVSHYLGVFGTFNFFALGLVMFVLNGQQMGMLARRIFVL